jgi:hypothetical protein
MTDQGGNSEQHQNHPLAKFEPRIDTSITEANSFIQKEWKKKGLALVGEYSQSVSKASTSERPSEIINALQDSLSQGQKLAGFFNTLVEDTGEVMTKAIAKKGDDSKSIISGHKTQQSSLRSEKEDLEGKAAVAVGVATGGVGLAFFTFGLGLKLTAVAGAAAAGFTAEANDKQKQIDALQSTIDNIEQAIKDLGKEKKKIADKLSPNNEILAFGPLVMAYRYKHAKGIFEEIEKCAKGHGTSVDKIAEFLKQESPEVFGSFMALVRADYGNQDLRKISEYANKCEIKGSPEQAALLQFVNHAVVPHMDYFEIWASKIDDLKAAEDDIRRMLSVGDPKLRPNLELFGEKPISLSGTLAVDPTQKRQNELLRLLAAKDEAVKKANYDLAAELRDKADKLKSEGVNLPSRPQIPMQFALVNSDEARERRDEEIERLSIEKDEAVKAAEYDKAAELRKKIEKLRSSKEIVLSGGPKSPADAANAMVALRDSVQKTVVGFIDTLYDESSGPLRKRHENVRDQALQRQKEFNRFFVNIDKKLHEIEDRLKILPGQIDNLDFRLDRAVGIQSNLEMLEARDPARIHAETTSANFIGEGLRILFEDDIGKSLERGVSKLFMKVTGRAIGSEARTMAVRLRQEREYAILKKAAQLRRQVDPEPLRKQLDELEKEYEKLLTNKEFLEYVANDPALEQTRAMYMLLPRLIAGEGNMDAVEIKAQRAGYGNVDEFIGDLRGSNPRLGEAMQRYVFGIANTNDLKVIVSEANAIQEPKEKREKVLVEYVEDIIKERYRDIARQASIMDYLEMRNVIYTGKPFHSFGEIVRYETDAALQALLSGKGDFNLVGSNDVRQIFDYYQDRHGEGIFKSVHEPSGIVDDRVNTGKATTKRAHIIRSDEIRLKQREVISNRHPIIPRVSSIFTEICAHEYLLSQGKNVVKDRSLASSPEYPGVLEMVNSVTEEFVKRLALDAARTRKRGDDKAKPEELGNEIESLIAQTFVDFFSELGAIHSTNPSLKDKRQKVKNAYTGENYAVPLGTFTQVATDDAKEAFPLFLEVYQHNLEKYLEVATRDNRKKILQQLDEVKDLMLHVQPSNQTTMPDSESARMKANYRNHSLSNLGVNPSTWVLRAEALHRGGSKELG